MSPALPPIRFTLLDFNLLLVLFITNLKTGNYTSDGEAATTPNLGLTLPTLCLTLATLHSLAQQQVS